MEKQGIVCLSAHPDGVLMWSHYADGHKGVAIRFKMDPKHLVLLPVLCFFVEVTYTDLFPRLNFFDCDTFDFACSVFGTKAKAWQHEGEWRIVLLDRTGYVSIPPGMVDGVITGPSNRP